jgi:L-glutamine-phosphate cytidylyltransferase
MKVIILAAGIGSRLGNPKPKPLTPLSNGETILERQIKNITKFLSIDDIYVIVGFKKDIIMEEFPEVSYVFNNIYDQTNTSKSLIRGLKKTVGHDVLWMNGDVVFDEDVLQRVLDYNDSCMAVNTMSVGDEEVKYNVNKNGCIKEVSKTVLKPLGESVGINKIIAKEIPKFIKMLDKCEDDDYFEKGIEFAIEKGMKIYPVDVSDKLCIEVDFKEDLESANRQLQRL